MVKLIRLVRVEIFTLDKRGVFRDFSIPYAINLGFSDVSFGSILVDAYKFHSIILPTLEDIPSLFLNRLREQFHGHSV